MRAQTSSSSSRARGRPAHLGERGVHELGVAGQRRRAEALRLVDHPLHLVGGDVDETALPGVGDGLDEDEVAQALQQVGGEAPRVVPRLDEPVDRPEHGGPVTGAERVDDVVEDRDVGDPEQRPPRARR